MKYEIIRKHMILETAEVNSLKFAHYWKQNLVMTPYLFNKKQVGMLVKSDFWDYWRMWQLFKLYKHGYRISCNKRRASNQRRIFGYYFFFFFFFFDAHLVLWNLAKITTQSQKEKKSFSIAFRTHIKVALPIILKPLGKFWTCV